MLNLRDNSMVEAKMNFEKALEIKPNDYLTHMHYAQYHSRLGDHKNRLLHNAEANRLQPNSRPASYNHIISLLHSRKASEAYDLLEEKKHLFTDSIYRKHGTSIKVFLNKDWKEVIYAFQEYLKENPNDFRAHFSIAYAYWHFARDSKNYLKHAKIVYDSINNIAVTLRYFDALMVNGLTEEGKDIVDDLGEIQDTATYFSSDDLYIIRARYNFYMKDYEKALRNYNKIIGKKPYWVYRNQALTLAHLGMTDEAISFMNNYIDLKILRAQIFAALKQKDSMYAALDAEKNIFWVKDEIYLEEFDPYREEPRFQKFQEDNYIQFTY